jgi:hypothetical protein
MVDLGLPTVGGTRWFGSLVLRPAASDDDCLTCTWPLDTERFLPKPVGVVAGDSVLLAARSADGVLYAAHMAVQELVGGADDPPELSLRQALAWRTIDRRTHARRTVELGSSTAERLTASGRRQPLLLSIRNVSAGGLLVRVEEPVTVGERLSLTFGLGGDPTPVQVLAEVRRVVRRREASREWWEAGCAFLVLDAADRERIAGYAELRSAAAEAHTNGWLRRTRRVIAPGLVTGLVVAAAYLGLPGQLPSTLAASPAPTGLIGPARDLAAVQRLRPARRTDLAPSDGRWVAYGYAIVAPPSLWPALEQLRARGYDWALDSLNARPTTLAYGSLRPHVSGVYHHGADVIQLASALEQSTVEVRSAVLLHESTHLSDVLHGRWEASSAACLAFEERAVANQATFWRDLWGPSGKPSPADEWEAGLNDLVWSFTFERAWGQAALSAAYADECAT